MDDKDDVVERESNRGQGYKNLIVWKNAAKLRKLVYEITKRFPRSEYRRVSQMRDAARSIKQNIQEGYKRRSIREYIQSLSVAQGSLSELRGDIDDCYEDKLISHAEILGLNDLNAKTDYLFNRLMTSLVVKEKEGSWERFPSVPSHPFSPSQPSRKEVRNK